MGMDGFLVSHLNHGEADDLVTQLEALLEYLGDGVFFRTFILGVHDGIVDIGIKAVPHIAEDLHTQAC